MSLSEPPGTDWWCSTPWHFEMLLRQVQALQQGREALSCRGSATEQDASDRKFMEVLLQACSSNHRPLALNFAARP